MHLGRNPNAGDQETRVEMIDTCFVIGSDYVNV
jgi:hypothetical protein